jgi:adenylate cyclase
MSANVYTIQDLLIGKTYRSNSLTGEIVSAEIHPQAVWYEGCESYRVQVRDSLRGNYTYRSVAVKVGE